MIRYLKSLGFFALLIIVGALGILNYTSTHIPVNPPELVVKYNDALIKTLQGEHVWMDSPLEGNSFLTENPFNLTQNLTPILVLSNQKIRFNFESKVAPNTIRIHKWITPDKSEQYTKLGSTTKGEFIAPQDKGTYIFEINAGWDDTHWTSDIFKIRVE